ncbi:MAG: hypothetical protein H6747_05785 [Deltaproteobacteria bacterium]|nr:hypothetical protein [Deltaproteobacteria bacterium]
MGQKSKLVQITTWTLVAAMALTGLYVGLAPRPDPRGQAAAEAAAAKAAIEAARAQAAAEAEAKAAAVAADKAAEPAPAVVEAAPARLVRVDLPPNLGGAETPVIVGLHGRGDTATGFAGLAGRLAKPGPDGPLLAWRGLEAPYPWGPGKAWFLGDRARPEKLDEAMALVGAELRELKQAGRKVAVFGFSQGCMMIAHLSVMAPDLLDAAVCVGGAVVGSLPKPPNGARMPPVLVVAGTSDPVVAIADQRALIAALESHGITTEQIEHPGAHTIPAAEIPAIRKWLREKLLDAPRL